MATELNPVDVKNAPSLPELVDEVRRTNCSRVIRADGEDVAVLMPAPPHRQSRKRTFTRDDALFSVIGIGRSGQPTDMATQKDDYLAEALLAECRPSTS